MIETMNDKRHLDTKFGFFKKDGSAATIYVGNLSYEMDELDIKELFEEFGVVNYVKMIKDQSTNRSKGLAFVQMINKKQAQYAISELNGEEIDGRTLKVSIAVESNQDNTPVKKKRRKPYKAYISKKDRGL